MAVKIRLTRLGKKKQPVYRVVVMDSRKARDGKYIEQIGRYAPLDNPSLIEIDNEKALKWLKDGAQPTDRVRKLLEISGAWTEFRIARGDIHTVDSGPASQSKNEAEPEAKVETEPEPASEEPAAATETAVETDTPDTETSDAESEGDA
ncbi:MAG: 30S ribosomal protein S16 [Acidobacteria bacterium]|nr:30S ribosomal protein S16 [Acidobacteriota bacterium]MCH8985797.1 30S ribosomal protein S16 [Acidobacteriota bacterium]